MNLSDPLNWIPIEFKLKIIKGYTQYYCGDLTLILSDAPSPRDMLFIRDMEGKNVLIRKGPFSLNVAYACLATRMTSSNSPTGHWASSRQRSPQRFR